MKILLSSSFLFLLIFSSLYGQENIQIQVNRNFNQCTDEGHRVVPVKISFTSDTTITGVFGLVARGHQGDTIHERYFVDTTVVSGDLILLDTIISKGVGNHRFYLIKDEVLIHVIGKYIPGCNLPLCTLSSNLVVQSCRLQEDTAQVAIHAKLDNDISCDGYFALKVHDVNDNVISSTQEFFYSGTLGELLGYDLTANVLPGDYVARLYNDEVVIDSIEFNIPMGQEFICVDGMQQDFIDVQSLTFPSGCDEITDFTIEVSGNIPQGAYTVSVVGNTYEYLNVVPYYHDGDADTIVVEDLMTHPNELYRVSLIQESTNLTVGLEDEWIGGDNYGCCPIDFHRYLVDQDTCAKNWFIFQPDCDGWYNTSITNVAEDSIVLSIYQQYYTGNGKYIVDLDDFEPGVYEITFSGHAPAQSFVVDLTCDDEIATSTEPLDKIEFNIYPNPINNGFININLNETDITGMTYVVTDVAGGIVKSGNFLSKIEMGGLPPGFYFFSLTDGGGLRGVRKFIVGK